MADIWQSIDEAPNTVRELFDFARLVSTNAYAPYSGCRVGAAVRTIEGVYVGCNVENASYGATNCAERVAIGTAVAKEGLPQIIEVMIVTDVENPWPPCGLCRQVIAEFGQGSIIYMANHQGRYRSVPFAELFPDGFEPGHLQKS